MGLMSTSIVERANLDLRTRVRRFIRLTNEYSKRAENQAPRVQPVRDDLQLLPTAREDHGINTTPAMAAGLEERPWRILEVVERMDGERQVFAV